MLRVALWQMSSGGTMDRCRSSVMRGIARAAAEKAHVVSFPENSLGLGCSDAKALSFNDDLQWVGKAAQEHNIDVCMGVIEKVDNSTKSFNSVGWWSKDDGKIKGVYRKMHLFDHAPSGLCESDTVLAGKDLVTVECNGVKCGLAICYDIRFPAMFLKYARAGCQIIFAPSAFTVPTGQAHFRALVSARARDSQCFIAAAEQWGQHTATRSSWGESCVADPWGQVLVAAEPGDEVLLVQDCNTSFVTQVRNRMPLQQHAIEGIDF